MAKQPIEQLKAWFSRGKYPTEGQFWDWLDSFFHKDDKMPMDNIDGLYSAINDRYPATEGQALEAQLQQVNADLREAISSEVSERTSEIARVDGDIEQIRQTEANRQHFKGLVQTVADLDNITDITENDFAWVKETGTQWSYSNGAWADTLIPIPAEAVEKSATSPLMDGAASAGSENMYAAGDHRHPIDTSREPAFNKNSAFNKNFGTAAGTVCEGSDSRVTGALSKTGGTMTGDLTVNAQVSDLSKTISDAFGITRNGKYIANSGTANRPGNSTYVIDASVYDTTYIKLIAQDVLSDAVFMARKQAGTWGGWILIATSSNTHFF